MDGNGRWAAARGLPRTEGHRAGADAVKRVVEAAPELGIRTLTLYAFSSDNWKRPPAEVDTLMSLFGLYLKRETGRAVANGIRITVIGRRDRLGSTLRAAVKDAETATHSGTKLHLRIAVDYSSRDAILTAAVGGASSREQFTRALGPDADLIIRTGGEQRLSDFLLWESAYAELVFTPRMWPDFDRGDLERALADFRARNRRFGGLPQLTPAA
jgi:undecaprenyl diphosphate synthase